MTRSRSNIVSSGRIPSVLGTFIGLAFLASLPNCRAEEPLPVPLGDEQTTFLERNCHDCHAGDEPENGLRLDVDRVVFGDLETRRRWTYLYDRVANGQMPPPDAHQPPPAERGAFLESLAETLTRADRDDNEVVLRRLNRNEYTNTVRDLFGVHVDVSRILLDDSTDRGFDNVGSALAISSEQMQTYVEAADVVVDAVFGPERPTESVVRTTNFATNARARIGTSERKLADGVVLYSSAKDLPTYGAGVRVPGLYRVKVRVRAEQTSEPVVMHVKGGGTGRIPWHSVGFFEAPPGRTTTVEFSDRAIEKSDCFGFGLVAGYPHWKLDPDTYEGPGLFIGDIEIEGPIDEWTAARRRLLGDVDPETGTPNDVRIVLTRFVPRAFRRPVEESEIAPYVGLAERALADGRTFERALRLALKGVLCAPEFLYLEEPLSENEEFLADYAIAARLSYFLWSSLPDDELVAVANRGGLRSPDALRAQVERMLADPRSERFVENFAGQWLRVRDIDFTVPDRNLYPEFGPLLRDAMVAETYGFFREVLDHDLGVRNFLDSDFLMLNEPLAEFYGIEGVRGLEIRRVPRPEGSVRGGVLTQASVLKVSADGTRTSPVLRGKWIHENLFGRTMPPPPASVEIVQPDIRGAETIREQLAAHRADASCARCHDEIDPPGFALESFDVQGGYREWYRTRGQGAYVKRKRHPFAEQNVRYRRGPAVDATGTMPDGRQFTDVREYKRLLLEDETAIARSLARLLLAYSLGRELGFSDRAEVERIVAATRANDHGLRSIVHEVVRSTTFRSP